MHRYPDKRTLFTLLGIAVVASFVGAKLEHFGPAIAPGLSGGSASAIQSDSEALGVRLFPALVEKPKITLGFVGDIMLGRGVKTRLDKNLGGDYAKLFENASFLKEPDIMFANLEGPVSSRGRDQYHLYSFRFEPKVIPVLKDAGIDVVSVSNNHEYDWGGDAYVDTINGLRDGGLLTCGGGLNRAEAVQPAVVTKDGYKVGFLCFTDVGPEELVATENKAGLLSAKDPEFDTIIKNGAANVDALIVSFHWGDEYKEKHNARQEELAKRAIAAGAVMIASEHPHVAQDIADYDGIPVVYSLGNFIFDQGFSEETMRGLFVTATLKDKKISDLVPHIITLDSNFAPSLPSI